MQSLYMYLLPSSSWLDSASPHPSSSCGIARRAPMNDRRPARPACAHKRHFDGTRVTTAAVDANARPKAGRSRRITLPLRVYGGNAARRCHGDWRGAMSRGRRICCEFARCTFTRWNTTKGGFAHGGRRAGSRGSAGPQPASRMSAAMPTREKEARR